MPHWCRAKGWQMWINTKYDIGAPQKRKSTQIQMNISSTHVPFASVEHLVIFFYAYSLMVPKQHPPLFFKKLAGMTWRFKDKQSLFLVYFFICPEKVFCCSFYLHQSCSACTYSWHTWLWHGILKIWTGFIFPLVKTKIYNTM